MQITTLFTKFDELQKLHGDNSLDAVYGCGETNSPKFCFVFMNPTGRNISSNKSWTGIKAPWLGTKNVWRMFHQLDLINTNFLDQINVKKPAEWDYRFCQELYQYLKDQSIYITNLSKATQIDARPLANSVFKQYLEGFFEEIDHLKPKTIICFGNQVSSIILNKNIKVGEYRKRHEVLEIHGKNYNIYPVHYPVWQWMRNISIAKEDIEWIVKNIN